MNGGEHHMRLRLRIPRWQPMADPTAPNSMSTPTLAGLMAAWWEVILPLVQWGLAWIQAHSTIVFPPGYELVLKVALSATVMFAAVRWHMGPNALK